jgi:choline dehydrogenase
MKRSTSRNSYLRAAEDRPNLQVMTSTQVERLIISPSRSVEGVVVIDQTGWKTRLTSRLEVILSAGAFQTPQILMLSGIGNKKELEPLGITTVVDNPRVGKNLQDHISWCHSFEVTIATATQLKDPEKLNAQVVEYFTAQKGLLTTSALDVLAFERVSDEELKSWGIQFPHQYPSDWPNFQYIPAPDFYSNSSGVEDRHPPKSYKEANYAGICSVMHTGASLGTVGIRSNKIEDLPVVDLNFLDSEWDRKLLVGLFKK